MNSDQYPIGVFATRFAVGCHAQAGKAMLHRAVDFPLYFQAAGFARRDHQILRSKVVFVFAYADSDIDRSRRGVRRCQQRKFAEGLQVFIYRGLKFRKHGFVATAWTMIAAIGMGGIRAKSQKNRGADFMEVSHDFLRGKV